MGSRAGSSSPVDLAASLFPDGPCRNIAQTMIGDLWTPFVLEALRVLIASQFAKVRHPQRARVHTSVMGSSKIGPTA